MDTNLELQNALKFIEKIGSTIFMVGTSEVSEASYLFKIEYASLIGSFIKARRGLQIRSKRSSVDFFEEFRTLSSVFSQVK